jgi:hypothetical protein
LVWLAVGGVFVVLPARRSSPAVGSGEAAGEELLEMTRSRTADGVVTIHGSLVAEFAAGDRIAVLHVAFCPPFEWLPTVEAKKVAGPACDVKIAQILHQGARIEVRLSRASTSPRRATIAFRACSHPPLAD